MKENLIEFKRTNKKFGDKAYFYAVRVLDKDNPDDIRGIEEGIKYFDSLLDAPYYKTESEFPIDLLGSIKYTMALKELLLSKFYRKSEVQDCIIDYLNYLSSKSQNSGNIQLNAINIDNNKISEQLNKLREKLRLSLFDYIQQTQNGFIENSFEENDKEDDNTAKSLDTSAEKKGLSYIEKLKSLFSTSSTNIRPVLEKFLKEKSTFIKREFKSALAKVVSSADDILKDPDSIYFFYHFLFSDHKDLQVLRRKYYYHDSIEGTMKEKVISVLIQFNKDLLKTLIRKSINIYFYFNRSLKGSEYRKLYFISTRSGLYIEFNTKNIEEDSAESQSNTSEREANKDYKLEIVIEKPTGAIIKNSNKLESFLENIFKYILSRYNKLFARPPVFSLYYRNRLIKVGSEKFEDIFPLISSETPLDDEDIGFDSGVESYLYRKLADKSKSILGKVRRDAEIIAINGKVIIPDFQIDYHQQKIFIEVIGFWTEQYKQKKYNKLKMLADQISSKEARKNDPESPVYNDLIKNFILYIDAKLNFEKLPFPTFYYSENNHQTSELIEYIKALQKPIFNEVKDRINGRIIKDLKEVADNNCQNSRIIDTQLFIDKWGLESKQEVSLVLKELWNENNNNNILDKIFIPYSNFEELVCKTWLDTKIDQLRSLFYKENRRELSFSKIRNEFKDIDEGLLNKIIVLAHFRKKYKSLNQLYVVFPDFNKSVHKEPETISVNKGTEKLGADGPGAGAGARTGARTESSQAQKIQIHKKSKKSKRRTKKTSPKTGDLSSYF
ncbi:MAG: DUF790 family protein [Promethearchaeota archaeon]